MVDNNLSLNMAKSLCAALDNNADNLDPQAEIEQLKARLEKCERALDVEVWNGKLAKFVKFRDMPEVAKVLLNG